MNFIMPTKSIHPSFSPHRVEYKEFSCLQVFFYLFQFFANLEFRNIYVLYKRKKDLELYINQNKHSRTTPNFIYPTLKITHNFHEKA